ncbi:VaFE repeat-containing surface-anchored protein [Enterococcus plantarum]|uniref:VaFE repeat-containing surface-anchored protein n=1 Tax=Enterococcus plantarum TaxID=1077675 RepID=UPI001A8CA8A5|nr:VaFE repeat-containing surface-anchored protein [Enterococcus plantarum]MBO0466736.1 VaFE repeat-containing surface-anchored protein [Enterococcus plantarum]
MKLKLKKIMTYLALLFTLTSNFLPMLQPVVAYAENETSVSEKIEQRPNVETVESRENEPLENSSEDSSASFDQSTDSSVELETDNIEIENENKMTKESTDQRSAKELASRIDPYDVQGLSDEEIISLAQYMYGDYVNSNPTAKIYVTNDKGNVIDIPFYQTYAVGSMELMPMNYSVSLGDTWLIKVSKIEKFRIDGKIAYCVQPGVPFNEGEGYVPHPSVGFISESQKKLVNSIVNFGSNGADSNEFYIATQFYVWESLGYTVQSDLTNYAAYKAQIDANANNHRTKPSFDGQEFTIIAGETLEINDSRGVFTHYREVNNGTNTSISNQGNTLRITPSAVSNNGEINFQRDAPNSGAQYFWVMEGKQTMVTAGELESTQAKIRVNIIKTGSIAARKIDEEGLPLTDATFRFEHSGIVEERVTDQDGIARLDDILMGTEVTITEIKAPDGRVIDSTPQKAIVEVNQLITKQFINRWARQPIKLIKREKDANRPLKGVPFALYKVTGVTKVQIDEFKTDENGEINIESLIYNKDGYIFKELEPLHGFLPNENDYAFKVTPENNGQLLIVDVDNEPKHPIINTTATGKNGEKFVDPTKELELEDTIQYKWLFTGRTYLYATRIIDQATAEVLETFTGSFIPLAYEGSHVVKVKVDGHKYRGRSLVFYEYIYDTVSKKEVAKHEEINDSGQTIKVNDPKIETKAQGEDGRQLFNPLKKVTVNETVIFTDLVAGHKYTTTVQGYKLSDETAYENASLTKTFIATNSNMEMTFEFELDGKELQGNGIVFTERLFYESEEMAIHLDLSNEEQTVQFTDPKIVTKAQGKNELQLFDPHAKVPVKETAVLTDLIIGDEYKVTVQGYRLSTGKPYEKVKEELVFTATETEMEQSFDFILDGKDLAGDSIVFTETLSFNNETIAEHKDLSNKKQTITFTDPKIKTKAYGDEQNQMLDPLQKVSVKETAQIKDLITGNEYTVVVQGHRLSTGEVYEKVHEEYTFTADKKEKTVEFDFMLEGRELRGDGIVFTETLSHDTEIIATHDDLNNKDQTVHFNDPTITTIAQGLYGEKIFEAASEVIIIESAKITGLVIGNQYTVKVTAHRLSDGSIINGIGDQKNFIAEKTEMTMQFEFKVDGKQFSNDGIVFTETLETKNEIIGKHFDLKNEQQTVRFKPVTSSIVPGPKSAFPSTGERVSQIILWLGLFIIVFSGVVWLNFKQNKFY